MVDRSEQMLSRRKLMQFGAGAFAGGAAALSLSSRSALAAAAEASQYKISDVQTMTVKGYRTYVYVRILTSDGHSGIGEGYGTPDVGTAARIMAIKPYLVGKNPLEIQKIYTLLDTGAPSLAGTRTDGSAHNAMHAASAIDMALWDLAGNILNTPTSVLLGGQFKPYVRVYDHSGPRDPFDKGAVSEWAAKVKADPSGFTAHKIGVPRAYSIWSKDQHHRPGSFPDATLTFDTQELTTREVIRIGQAFENMREALGWGHDFMVHFHWGLDLPSALKVADAVAPMKPLWVEDPLGVAYSESWKLLTEKSPVPILCGENLIRIEEFKPFIINNGVDLLNLDLRNTGGFTEGKRIAALASLYGMPVNTHDTGSQLHCYQAAQWASSIQNFGLGETVTGRGGWMDQILKLDGPYIEKGYIKTSNKPGTGVTLNREVVEAHLAPGEKWWGDV